MDLKELREKIDEVDEKIAALYEERIELSSKIAQYKIENGLEVFDAKREAQKIESVRSMVHKDEDREGIGELFEHIMALSKKRQYEIMDENSPGPDLKGKADEM